MPNYEYECETCGPFTENRPMAEFDLPQPCPDCGDMAPRLLTCPALGGGAVEDAGMAVAPAARHPEAGARTWFSDGTGGRSPRK
jgi:putative FmdB family regulatory protein